jgi:thiamine kinase-like enzyme
VTSPAELTAILLEACTAAGLTADGAEPIRLGENTIFRVCEGVVVRIARPGQQAAARREVAVSHWLNASGVVAVAAVADIQQPIEVGGRSVTFWEELRPHHHGSLIQVAAVLKRLHALPVPNDVLLGQLDPFVRLAERIKEAVTVPAEDGAWLQTRLSELKGRWEALVPDLPTCVVHGDAWSGNVVATDDGRIVLLDLERCAVGPPEWDLVSSAVKYVTYGRVDRAEYQAFCDAYGSDVTTWSDFPVLRDIRELRMTCYVAQQAATDKHFEHEARLRIDCLRGRRGTRPWTWTAAE